MTSNSCDEISKNDLRHKTKEQPQGSVTTLRIFIEDLIDLNHFSFVTGCG